MYYGCCTLKIVFSTLSDVTVRFNNDKSRDYLDPTLPSAPGMPTLNDPSAPGGMAGMAGLVGQQPMMGAGGQWGHSQQGVGVGMGQGFGGASGFGAMQAAAAAGAGGASPVVIVAGFNADTTQPDQLFTLFGLVSGGFFLFFFPLFFFGANSSFIGLWLDNNDNNKLTM